MSARNPDAALIRVCAQHVVNMDAFNASSSMNEAGNAYLRDPLWLAYSKTRDAITAARPKTMDGVAAIARAALAENSGQDPEFTGLDERWAWTVLQGVLRLHGEG